MVLLVLGVIMPKQNGEVVEAKLTCRPVAFSIC
jgi:hypothetical protein